MLYCGWKSERCCRGVRARNGCFALHSCCWLMIWLRSTSRQSTATGWTIFKMIATPDTLDPSSHATHRNTNIFLKPTHDTPHPTLGHLLRLLHQLLHPKTLLPTAKHLQHPPPLPLPPIKLLQTHHQPPPVLHTHPPTLHHTPLQ